MKDEHKTKEQLIRESDKLRRRIAELEVAEAGLKQAQERIGHLNLVLRAIRSVNQLLSKERDCHKLIKGTCDSLIENRGYYNAWIAILDESRDLVTTAEAGLGKDFLPMLERLKRAELTNCAQKALVQSEVVLTEDPFYACIDCPLSNKYAGRGAMTIRLECEGEVYGVLSVSIPRDLLPDKDEQALFKEVAGDIAFALHSLELEEERKRAEHALRESEDKYRTIFETTSTATIIIDEDMTISLANTEFETLSGYSKEELEGKKSWTDFVAHKDDLERMKEYHKLRRIDPNAAPRNYEYKFIDKKGAVKDIFATVAVIPGTTKTVGSFMDITDRRQAEEALQESEQRFRNLVENSLTGISIIQDNRIVYQNPAQQRLLESSPESFGLANFETIHPDDVEKVTQFYQRITSGDAGTLDTDFRFYPPGKMHSRGDMKWAHCRASLVEYQGKEAMLVNMMDMTEAKELEHLLRVQDKMSSLGRVAAGIAHEIRNPLSGINIYLKTLEKIYDQGEGFEKPKEILGRLQSASSKIESVIRRVMDFSKPSEPRFALTDINQPVEEAIKLSSVTLRKSGITLEKALTENLPRCPIDPHMIEEVVLNLITNAAEAMKGRDRNKRIEIACSMAGDRILVSVSDSGPGVPPNLRDQIFDPFYTTKNGSTGIGLSLSHRIITDHGGSLGVLTSKWGGAEFMIEIPLERPTDQK